MTVSYLYVRETQPSKYYSPEEGGDKWETKCYFKYIQTYQRRLVILEYKVYPNYITTGYIVNTISQFHLKCTWRKCKTNFWNFNLGCPIDHFLWKCGYWECWIVFFLFSNQSIITGLSHAQSKNFYRNTSIEKCHMLQIKCRSQLITTHESKCCLFWEVQIRWNMTIMKYGLNNPLKNSPFAKRTYYYTSWRVLSFKWS